MHFSFKNKGFNLSREDYSFYGGGEGGGGGMVVGEIDE